MSGTLSKKKIILAPKEFLYMYLNLSSIKYTILYLMRAVLMRLQVQILLGNLIFFLFVLCQASSLTSSMGVLQL